MTTYYVDPAAADDTGVGTAGDPKKIIDSAYQLCSTGDIIELIGGAGRVYDDTTQGAQWYIEIDQNSINVTIQPYLYPSQPNEITLAMSSTSTLGVRLDANTATATFNDITFDVSGAVMFITRATDKSVGITLNNCPVNQTGTGTYCIRTADNAAVGGSYIFRDCAITTVKNLGSVFDLDLIEFSRCTLSYANDIYLDGTITKIIYDDNTMANTADTASNGLYFPTTSFVGCTYLRIHGNTLSFMLLGIRIADTDMFEMIDISNNTITVKHATNATAGISLGLDFSSITDWADTTAYTVGLVRDHNGKAYECVTAHTSGDDTDEPGVEANWRTYWIEYQGADVTCVGNTVDFTTPGQCHALFLGYEVRNAEVSYNTVSGGNFGIVNKGVGNNVHHNITAGANPLSVFSGEKNKLHHNVSYATTGAACVLGDQDTNFTRNNIVVNNIFVSTANFAFSDDGNTADGKDFVDYNCYYRIDAGNLATLGGANKANLAAMQAYWLATSAVYPLNDEHSINADPLFVDAAGGDFRLRSGSPCIKQGYSGEDDNYTADMGSYAALPISNGLYINKQIGG